MICMEFMTHLVLDYKMDSVWVSAISWKISLGMILLILWTNFAHALLKLKTQTVTYDSSKITYHFAQPFINEWNNINTAIDSLHPHDKSFNKNNNCKTQTATIKFKFQISSSSIKQ